MPASPLPPDPYKVLNVPKDATIATIRSVYRKLVLTCHPDKFPDETIKAQKAEEFHRVQQAYELLSDDKSRERYDAQVRLAELKAEKFREEASRGPPSSRREEPLFSPRPQQDRSYTTASPIFEEIRPKARYYEEPLRSDPRPSPRYDDYRPRRDYDDYDDFSPSHGAARKGGASSRAGDARPFPSMSAKDKLRAAAAKMKEQEREREAENRRKSRDKSRREDGTSKRQHVKIPFGVSASEESDSEIDNFMRGAKSERERPRSYEEDKYYARRKHESRHSSPDRDSKLQHNIRMAAEYISGSKMPSSRGDGRRPSLGRAQSSNRNQPPPPPPPPPPAPMPVEDVVRSSGRRNAVSSKSKSSSSKKVTEIVEPPRREFDPEPRRPELKTATTSPSVLKHPTRSSTMDAPRSERQKAHIRRAATGPIAPKNSKMHDSGYSSPGTPEIMTPRSTKYKIEVESESDSDGKGPRFHVIAPKESSSRRGEASPRHASYRSERSERGHGSIRHGPSRSHTADEPSSHHRPAGLSRAASERPGRLFGEVTSSPDRAQYQKFQQSPRIRADDIQYGSLPRRASPPERSSRTDHREAYEYARRGSEGLPLRPRQAQEV